MDLKTLADFLTERSSVILMVIDSEGNIVKTNNFADCYLYISDNSTIYDVIIDHQDTFKIEDIESQPATRFLSFNNVYNDPQTFKITTFRENERIYFFGETNFRENLKLQKEMVLLNNEYAELTRELYKKNMELKKLDEMKNQFLGIAAHDLRNPIGNIVSIAHLLNEELVDSLEPQQQKFLHVISQLGEFGLNLLNDLLEYSKITSGKRQLNLKKINPNKLIKETIEFNQFYANSNNIELLYKSQGKVKHVSADQQAFHQILNNLISNAVKFSPEHSKVELGLIPGEKFHTFFVKDEGPGIPGQEQDKLFKPFSTTSAKPRNNEKSTGLGLWIVNNLVHSHGGNIWVKSSEGKGTVIYFSLPVENTSN